MRVALLLVVLSVAATVSSFVLQSAKSHSSLQHTSTRSRAAVPLKAAEVQDLKLGEETFEDVVLKEKLPVLVDFYANVSFQQRSCFEFAFVLVALPEALLTTSYQAHVACCSCILTCTVTDNSLLVLLLFVVLFCIYDIQWCG
jgi:hypothetical protein